MKLSGDIKNPWIIHLKAILFVIIGISAAGLIFLQAPTFKTGLLLVLSIWAFCRFYYYLFYVLERYLGREKRFAGIFDALCSLFARRREDR